MFLIKDPTTLALLSGLFWTIAYIWIIREGWMSKSYGMPFWALALNLAWEFLYGPVLIFQGECDVQFIVNTVWFLFDVIILVTYFVYGRPFFPIGRTKIPFMIWSVMTLIIAFAIQIIMLQHFKEEAPYYAAFIQNLLMSVLFINMLTERKSLQGQSLIIAVAKFLGSLFATIEFGYMVKNFFIIGFGTLTAVFDILYIWFILIAIFGSKHLEPIKKWTRS